MNSSNLPEEKNPWKRMSVGPAALQMNPYLNPAAVPEAADPRSNIIHVTTPNAESWPQRHTYRQWQRHWKAKGYAMMSPADFYFLLVQLDSTKDKQHRLDTLHSLHDDINRRLLLDCRIEYNRKTAHFYADSLNHFVAQVPSFPPYEYTTIDEAVEHALPLFQKIFDTLDDAAHICGTLRTICVDEPEIYINSLPTSARTGKSVKVMALHRSTAGTDFSYKLSLDTYLNERGVSRGVRYEEVKP